MNIVIRTCDDGFGKMRCFECGEQVDFVGNVGLFVGPDRLDVVCLKCTEVANPLLAQVYRLWAVHKAVSSEDAKRRWR